MIMEAEQAIKACGISGREYRDILPNYDTYKKYVEAKYESVDKLMRKYKKCGFQSTNVKLPSGKILQLRKCLEKKPLEMLIGESKPSGGRLYIRNRTLNGA